MATTADTTATDDTPADGWYAEVEWRRHLRNEYPDDSSHTLPVKPDHARAEHYGAREYEQQGVKYHSDKIVIPLSTTRQKSAEEIRDLANRTVKKLPVYKRNHPITNKTVYTTSSGFRLTSTEIEHLQKDTNWKKVQKVSKQRHANLGGHQSRKDAYETLKQDSTTDPDPRPIYVRVDPDHELCTLQNIIDKRRQQNRDAKILITARDGATGTGKTTLAVQLAKSWDVNGWDADKATLDGDEYIDKYTELDPGSILIGDELEGMADPRRSMSQQNVTLSQFWATMRQWEVSTICTFPSMRMVDVRLLELADIRINVIQRGVAVANRVKIGDYDGEVSEVPIHRIRWEPLDNDPDYQKVTEKKTERMENHAEQLYHLTDDGEEDDTPDPDTVRQKTRNELITEIYENTDVTQKELASAVPDISDRSTISKIVN